MVSLSNNMYKQDEKSQQQRSEYRNVKNNSLWKETEAMKQVLWWSSVKQLERQLA